MPWNLDFERELSTWLTDFNDGCGFSRRGPGLTQVLDRLCRDDNDDSDENTELKMANDAKRRGYRRFSNTTFQRELFAETLQERNTNSIPILWRWLYRFRTL